MSSQPFEAMPPCQTFSAAEIRYANGWISTISAAEIAFDTNTPSTHPSRLGPNRPSKENVMHLNHWREAETPLTFEHNEETFAVYSDRYGEEVCIHHGTGNVLVAFDDLDINALWGEFVSESEWWYHSHRRFPAFVAHLNTLTFDLDMVAEKVVHCPDCDIADLKEDCIWIERINRYVCEPCSNDYSTCSNCDTLTRDTSTTIGGGEVCEPCRENYYRWCEDCDRYYHYLSANDHQHDGSGCCESPQQTFSIPNDGEPALANDTNLTVTLPSGVISDEGIGAIANRIRLWSNELVDYGLEEPFALDQPVIKARELSFNLDEVGEKWQQKDGNFTKRLSRLAYKQYGLKLPPEVISEIGNLASQHSQGASMEVAVTRDLNMPPEEFANEDSCWWGSYSAGRCALKTNGGFGLRSFDSDSENCYYSEVSGRAWVLPLRRDEQGEFHPTFDTMKPDALAVFNGYGDLSGYTPARLLAHMYGMTYRKTEFLRPVTYGNCESMYVNGGTCYLVTSEDIAVDYSDDQAVTVSLPQHSGLFGQEQAAHDLKKEHAHV